MTYRVNGKNPHSLSWSHSSNSSILISYTVFSDFCHCRQEPLRIMNVNEVTETRVHETSQLFEPLCVSWVTDTELANWPSKLTERRDKWIPPQNWYGAKHCFHWPQNIRRSLPTPDHHNCLLFPKSIPVIYLMGLHTEFRMTIWKHWLSLFIFLPLKITFAISVSGSTCTNSPDESLRVSK